MINIIKILKIYIYLQNLNPLPRVPFPIPPSYPDSFSKVILMHRKQLYHQLFILIQSYKRSPNLIYTFKSLYSLTLSNQLTPHSLYLILYQKLSKKHFHYITNMTKSLQNNSYPRSMKFTILVYAFLVIITIYLMYLVST